MANTRLRFKLSFEDFHGWVEAWNKAKTIYWFVYQGLNYHHYFLVKSNRSFNQYQPSGAGVTRSPPTMLQRLQNPKWLTGGSKIDDGIRKGVSHRLFCLTSYWERQTKSCSNQNIILAKSNHFHIIFDLGSLNWLGAVAVSAECRRWVSAPDTDRMVIVLFSYSICDVLNLLDLFD